MILTVRLSCQNLSSSTLAELTVRPHLDWRDGRPLRRSTTLTPRAMVRWLQTSSNKTLVWQLGRELLCWLEVTHLAPSTMRYLSINMTGQENNQVFSTISSSGTSCRNMITSSHSLFRNVVMKDQYFLECRPDNPLVGDHLGQPAVTRWMVHSHRCGFGGGPFQWFHQYYRSYFSWFKHICITIDDQVPSQQHLLRSESQWWAEQQDSRVSLPWHCLQAMILL